MTAGAENIIYEREFVPPCEIAEARKMAIGALENAIPEMYEEHRHTKDKQRKTILLIQIENMEEQLRQLTGVLPYARA